MRVPLSWIRDFTPAPDDVDLLAATFNALGLVVESIERVGEGLDGVVVGRVLDVRTHPNADKVRLADVDLGTGESQQIACGAANLETGQLVPVATLGATLPNGMTIERRKMRGEWSNGMICAEDEIGLSDERSGGIMVLPEGLEVGAPFAAAMGIERDVVFDLEIETNRPDAMCIQGVARDLAGKLRLAFTPVAASVQETGPPVGSLASIAIETTDCSRFTARVIENVTIAPSSDRVARRLRLAGMRPINNVVDASNYVMLEMGQPSHPYDRSRVPGAKLAARRAQAGDKIETLDGSQRELPDGACVICDGDDNVVGVAGIMGGASSEISPDTTEIILEAAVFDSYAVNLASRTMALRTEASARFERRIDREGPLLAQGRFCQILAETCPDMKVATGALDEDKTHKWPSPEENLTIRTSRVNAILGTDLTATYIAEVLERIGFACQVTSDEEIRTSVPPFRPDVEREIDVIEEVARIHGYDAIERRVPTSPNAARLTYKQQIRRRLRNVLAGQGFLEAWTATLVSPEHVTNSHGGQTVSLANAMTRDESVLRPSLLPGMLQAVAYNWSRRQTELTLFEIGHVFQPPQPQEPLVHERELLALAITGDDVDAMSASVAWRNLCHAMRLQGMSLVAGEEDGLHPTRSASIVTHDGSRVGRLGEVDSEVTRSFGIDGRVGWVEVEMESLVNAVVGTPQMQPVSRFPFAEFDLALVVENDVPADEVRNTLAEALGANSEVALFDVFRSEALGVDRRSLAFRLRVGSLDHTLSEAEVSEARSAAVRAAQQAHGAELRS